MAQLVPTAFGVRALQAAALDEPPAAADDDRKTASHHRVHFAVVLCVLKSIFAQRSAARDGDASAVVAGANAAIVGDDQWTLPVKLWAAIGNDAGAVSLRPTLEAVFSPAAPASSPDSPKFRVLSPSHALAAAAFPRGIHTFNDGSATVDTSAEEGDVVRVPRTLRGVPRPAGLRMEIAVASPARAVLGKLGGEPVVARRPLGVRSRASKPSGVPRGVCSTVVSYHDHFDDFSSIFTAEYEQRVSSHSSPATASLLGNDATARQIKLYERWQEIMTDVAVAGSLVSSAVAQYRVTAPSRPEVREIVDEALGRLGEWSESPPELGVKMTWNLLWTWSKSNIERKKLLAWQRVNHFQHAIALTRKDCLRTTIGKYQALDGPLKYEYDIMPRTFVLPEEQAAFEAAFHERNASQSPAKNIWIQKPVASSRGRGISLLNDLDAVANAEDTVVQEYIANPLLLDGFKFDLRLYVLVTSFNPLEAFFYEDGFIRLCTREYQASDLSDLNVHLTNSSIQKHLQGDMSAQSPIHSQSGGTKMPLTYLWSRLKEMGADVETVTASIRAVVLKALLCGEDHIPYQVNSFDLLGFDVMLDADLRPWLIEINSSPQMQRENPLDVQVKDALIYDTLKLVDPLRFDRSKLVEILKRRLKDKQPKRRTKADIAEAKHRLNKDLTEILSGKLPRKYGEMPEHTGRYSRLAPHTTIYNKLARSKQRSSHFSSC